MDIPITEEQQTQIEQIRQNERSQIEAIFTKEQRTQLQQAFPNWEPPPPEDNQTPPPAGEPRRMHRSPFASLNLTDEQRSQIEAIRQSSREQIGAILIPEQRQQLE